MRQLGLKGVKFVIDTYIFLKYYLVIRSGRMQGSGGRGSARASYLSILTFTMAVIIILRDSAIPLDVGVSY